MIKRRTYDSAARSPSQGMAIRFDAWGRLERVATANRIVAQVDEDGSVRYG
jgi:hypothetical protein